jgi:hypothetical protein
MKKAEISKEKLIELYVQKNMTTFEIGEIYGVNRSTISNYLKIFGIDTNPSQRKYKILKETPLTQEQKDLIVGSTLGDGSIILSGRKITPYFKIAHCEKQKDYLYWKKEILGNLVNNVSKNIDKRGNSIMYGFHTISHKDLNPIRKMFYENNKKVITENIIDYISPLGLAAWFMDDGSKTRSNNYRLSTDGFSEAENYILKEMLEKKFGVLVKVCEYTRHDKKFYYLSINKENSIKMTQEIKPYVVDCMKYKLIDCSPTTICQTSSFSKEKDEDDIV